MKVSYSSGFNVEVRPETQGKPNPARDEAASKVTMGDDQDITGVQPFFMILLMIIANLSTNMSNTSFVTDVDDEPWQ
jgi:hypothetical protein